MTGPRAYHRVPVAEVTSETDDACSIVLAVPPDLAGEFSYLPGQFVTARIPRGDGSVARCYSLSSSPHAGELPTITVKRMADGYASNWIADNVRAGGTLDLLPPAGTFTPGSLDGDFLLLAAGSGITPVISVLKSALALGHGQIMLIYANRDERSVIFSSELRKLAAAAQDRLLVVHWLDSVQGPPTAAGLAALARPYAGREAFLCGPDPFSSLVKQALRRLGLPPQAIHVERFLSLEENPFERKLTPSGIAATVEVRLDGRTAELSWPPGTRLLDAMIDSGLNPPYSCRQGICGACACQITSGEVELAHNEVLEQEDLDDGYILACQATALTPRVSITY